MTDTHTLGSYRLIAELGHGGMADVFLAVAQGPVGSGFTKLAVVKKLRSHLAEDPEFIAMLMDEARITARLAHPNVVQLFEVGEVNGEYFLAIEYLEGQPLHRIERRAGRMDITVPREAYYAIIADTLAGLHHAHELADYDGTPLEVAHRDVTPHNVFVRYDGTVKVVDFGIAKAIGRACVTQHGTLKGKVRYMSPEQAAGQFVDRRTDIFAAGVMLWNLATGSKLWADRSDIEVIQALCTGQFDPSPRASCPDVPDAIDAICRRALAFAPEDRYATADEMRTDLEAFLGRSSAEVRKALASTMKELFESDRANVRAVVESAQLTSVASIEVFTAAAVALPRAHDPSPDLRCVSPMVVTSSSDVTAEHFGRPRAAGSARGLQALVLVGALGAICFLAGSRMTRVEPAPKRVAATVAADLVTSQDATRSKADGPRELLTKKTAPRSTRAVGSSAASVDVPATATSRPADPAKPARPRSALDSSDPWVSGAP
ncbi:MAG TPA: serine/threonine-protein kinase [Labilithrix sp.]|nr:serine/threonine-protein kinase [Labilithrix sp.]